MNFMRKFLITYLDVIFTLGVVTFAQNSIGETRDSAKEIGFQTGKDLKDFVTSGAGKVAIEIKSSGQVAAEDGYKFCNYSGRGGGDHAGGAEVGRDRAMGHPA